ncbi:MAG: shikimate kinase [Candidatus Methanomethylophilaceae archaeon]|nr:shikimate kinase [Candidatus Methanomethylophilaceae archaeon]
MAGIGVSGGAISVMNAIPCGIGSTIGIALKTEARFEPADATAVHLVDRPQLSPNLAERCVERTLELLGEDRIDYHLEVKTDIPPSMGLKSSSSVCNAVISAVLNYYGRRIDPLDIIKLGVSCAKECKVTITGAFDDACGCGLGGLVVTDNSRNILISRDEIPAYDVVICVPDRSIPKSKVPVERYKALKGEYEALVPEIRDGYLGVLTKNGEYVSQIIGGGSDLARKALDLGALAAGISGTGPATAVLTERGDGGRMAEGLGCPCIITETS